MGRARQEGRFDRHLPRVAYAYAEANGLYKQVWRAITPAHVRSIVSELPPLVQVRAAHLSAMSVEPVLVREQPFDRRIPLANEAVRRWLAAGVRDGELRQFRRPALQSAALRNARATKPYRRAAESALHALEAALVVANPQGCQQRACLAVEAAAFASRNDCASVRGVLAPVVREFLARRFTAAMLLSARAAGLRLYGSLEERAVALDVALERDVVPAPAPSTLRPSTLTRWLFEFHSGRRARREAR